MSAEVAFREANELVVEDEYEAAVEKYSEAITTGPVKAEYFVKRAAAYSKLGQHGKALVDAKRAIDLDSTNCRAFFRKGLAFFDLDEFESALTAFKEAQRLDTEGTLGRKLLTCIRKCEAEMEDEDEDEGGADAPTVVAVGGGAAAAPAPAPAPAPPRFRHDWYQTPTHVVVNVLGKGIPEDRTTIEVEEQSLEIVVDLGSGSTFELSFSLFDAVDPATVAKSFRPTKLEIRLAKRSAFQWPSLERPSGAVPVVAAAAAPVAAAAAPVAAAAVTAAAGIPTEKPAYPSSSKRRAPDWDKLEKEIEKEEEEEKLEGDAALQKLFRQIYANADDDTRRAMIKSYQTSGGTVLSCNWDEVAKADYEKDRPKPPDGCEWRDREY